MPRVPGEFDDGLGGEDGVVALVDDDVEGGGVGQRGVVPEQPLLAGDDEVGRHREQPVGAGLLGELRVLHGERGAVPGARDHRHPARRLLDGGGDAARNSSGVSAWNSPVPQQAKTAAATGVDARAHVRAEDVEVERAVRPVRGDGEEQRPAGDAESGGERG